MSVGNVIMQAFDNEYRNYFLYTRLFGTLTLSWQIIVKN